MKDNIFKLLRINSKKNGQALSQKQLGNILKTQHVNELERGKRMPSLAQLKAYHSYFNVSYDLLLGSIMPDEDKTIKDVAKEIEVPEWLQNTNSPDEQMIAQLIHELTETGKGMVLLSYLAELIYSERSTEERYEMGEDNKLRKYITTDMEEKIHNFEQVVKEYRKIGNSARYNEAKIRIDNVIEKGSE